MTALPRVRLVRPSLRIAVFAAAAATLVVVRAGSFDGQGIQAVPGAFSLSNDPPYWDASAPAGPAVNLRWTASSGVTLGYEVYRNGTKIYPLSGTYTGLTFLNNLGLTGGQTYSYQIRAKNASGFTTSNTLNILMPTGPPVINNISPTSITASTFTLTINGSNFDSSAIEQVYWKSSGALVGNGSILSRSSTQIVVQESMASATPGTYQIRVKNTGNSLSNAVDLVLTTQSLAVGSSAATNIGSTTAKMNGSALLGSGSTVGWFEWGATTSVSTSSAAQSLGSTPGALSIFNQTLTGLSPNTTYFFRAAAQGSTTVRGATLSFATLPAPAISAVSPSTVAASSFAMTVTGSGFDGGAIDQIYLKSNNQLIGGGSIISRSSSQIVTQQSMTGASAAVYQVRIRNSDGTLSNAVDFTVSSSSTSPVISSISPTSVRPSSFNLTINGSGFSTNAVDQIYLKSNGQFIGAGSVLSRSSSQIVVTESMATASTTTYQVRVKNSNGTLSNAVDFALVAAPGPPTAISPGASSEGAVVSTLTPTFQWATGANAQTHGLYISKYPYGSNYLVYNNTSVSGNSLTLPQGVLVSGTKYRWNMTAFNAGGESSISNTLYFTVQAGTALPSAPSIIGPGSSSDPGAVLSSLTPTFSWNQAAGAQTYNIYISKAPYGDSNLVYAGHSIAVTSMTLPSSVLAPGTRYRWNLTSTNPAGEGPPSNTLYVSTKESPASSPSAPTDLVASRNSISVALSWRDNSNNESQFRIERRTTSGSYAQIAISGENANSYSDTSVAAGSGYCYRVRASNANGDSGYSAEKCVPPLSSSGQTLKLVETEIQIDPSTGLAAVSVVRSGGSSGLVGATLLVTPGSARVGTDYRLLPTLAVSFADGETETKTISVAQALITAPPNARTFAVQLISPAGATVAEPSKATVTIPAAAAPPGKVRLVDPACNLLACNGGLLGADGFLSRSSVSSLALEAFTDLAPTRTGASADGVTLLLLKVQTSVAVRLRLRLGDVSAPAKYGQLLQRDGSQPGQTLVVLPETGVTSNAYALYAAPKDFPETGSVDVPGLNVSVENADGTSAAIETELMLRRPPVVLVHGIWSSAQLGMGNLDTELAGSGFLYRKCADYEADNSGSFDPAKPSGAIDAFANAVARALDDARRGIQHPKGGCSSSASSSNEAIASSQVDVVAHSMGGLVARAREADVSLFNVYKRRENRFAGEIHKLITIGTPHQGTPAADWLWKYKDYETIPSGTFFGLVSVGVAMAHEGKKLGTAVEQLQTTSRVLTNLSTSFPVHTIVGTKPSEQSDLESQLNERLVKLTTPCLTVDKILDSANDVIVPASSQAGGLSGPFTKSVSGVIHTTGEKDDLKLAETQAPAVWAEIKAVLLANVSDAFGLIPKYSASPHQAATCPAQTATALERLMHAASFVVMTPTAGTVVRPGQAVTITLSLDDPGVNEVNFLARGIVIPTSHSGFDFTGTLTVPTDFAGDLEVRALTRNTTGPNYFVSTTLRVTPTAPPDSLAASLDEPHLVVVGQTTHVKVSGNYSVDDTDIEMTSSTSGTTYATESGSSSVVTVSAEGVVEARGSGTETILVRNGTLLAAVSVTVDITNQRPVLAAVQNATVPAGGSLDIPFAATDPNGNTLQLSGIGLPSFVVVLDNGNGTATVRVRPTSSDSGTYTISLAAIDDGTPALGASQTFQLQVVDRTVALTGSLAFGSVAVGSSAARSFTITNTGNSALTVNAVSCSTGFRCQWSGTIAAGAAQAVPVVFEPRAPGAYWGQVAINSNQTSGPNTLPAFGIGTAFAPAIVFRNYTTGQNALWYMYGGAQFVSYGIPSVTDVAWQIQATVDYNGDGWPDLIWRNPSTGKNAIWYMSRDTIASSVALPDLDGPAWRLSAAADCDGDGQADLLWRNRVDGSVVIWYMRGNQLAGTAVLASQPDLRVELVGAADFDGNATPDLVWRNTTTGESTIWYLDGANVTATGALPLVPQVDWDIVQVADLDSDGRPDLVWRNRTTGDTAIWYLADRVIRSSVGLPIVEPRWNILGSVASLRRVTRSDFNGDGNADLVWRNSTTGDNVIWYLAGPRLARTEVITAVPGASWRIGATGDFNGDGSADILWHQSPLGSNVIWLMQGSRIVGTAILPDVPGNSWQVAASADFNADGYQDLLWHDSASGSNVVWYLRGTSLMTSAQLPDVAGSEWSVGAAADFNHDGHIDLLWRNSSNGLNLIWYLGGGAGAAHIFGTAALETVADASWQIAGAFDVYGDGNAVILWRQETTGLNYLWFLDGTTVVRGVFLPGVLGANWRVAR